MEPRCTRLTEEAASVRLRSSLERGVRCTAALARRAASGLQSIPSVLSPTPLAFRPPPFGSYFHISFYLLYHETLQIEKLLIGFGFGFAAGDLADMYLNYSGVHGHLYIVIKLMDFGILGLFLELIYFFTIMRLTNFKFLYLFIPFFICGLSMAPGNLSFLYCFSGVVIFLEQNRNKILGVSYARRINQCNNANLQC